VSKVVVDHLQFLIGRIVLHALEEDGALGKEGVGLPRVHRLESGLVAGHGRNSGLNVELAAALLQELLSRRGRKSGEGLLPQNVQRYRSPGWAVVLRPAG